MSKAGLFLCLTADERRLFDERLTLAVAIDVPGPTNIAVAVRAILNDAPLHVEVVAGFVGCGGRVVVTGRDRRLYVELTRAEHATARALAMAAGEAAGRHVSLTEAILALARAKIRQVERSGARKVKAALAGDRVNTRDH